MDSRKIQDLAVDAGLLDIMRSEKTGRYYISPTASLAEVVLFARMVERQKEEELKVIRRLEVGG
jgi:hypothetical protein